jgi:hypothetical protein
VGLELEIGFTNQLQIVTTSNYNTIANLHTLKITPAQAKPYQAAFTCHFPALDLNNGDPLASVFVLLSSEYPTTLLQLTNNKAGGHLTQTSYSLLHRLPYN